MDFDFNDVNLNTLVTMAIKVVVILVLVLIISAIARSIVKRTVNSKLHTIRMESPAELEKRQKTISNVINQVISFVLWLIAFVMILGVLGIEVGPLIAAIGVAGLALGFAAQSIIKDYLNGVFVVMEDWYRIDEVVTIAGISGVVVDLNLRRTTLRDLDGTMHVIPNSKVDMASNKAREWSRINMNVGIAYKEKVDDVWQLTNQICNEFKEDPEWGPKMLTTPQVVRVDSLGDSAVELKIVGDTQPGQQFALMGELRRRIKNRYDQEGIEIPWPHNMVYFGNSPNDVKKI